MSPDVTSDAAPRAVDGASAERVPVVVLVVADLAARRRWAAQLTAAGLRVRIASRAAELAKALADGQAPVVVRSAAAADLALTAAVRAPLILTADPEHEGDALPDDLIARVRARQPTSSA